MRQFPPCPDCSEGGKRKTLEKEHKRKQTLIYKRTKTTKHLQVMKHF